MPAGMEVGCLKVFCDADWAGDVKDRKSTSGVLMTINGTATVWQCKKQSCVSLSSSEAEFIALAEAAKDVKWLRNLFCELELLDAGPTAILEDNTGAIKWETSEKRAKHLDIKYHFVKDLVDSGEIDLKYCPTKDMLADIMTKSLPRPRFVNLKGLLGLRAEIV